MKMDERVSKFQELLNWASFHLACDYGNEYLKGYDNLRQCARIAYEEGWGEDAVREFSKGFEGLATSKDVLMYMKQITS